MNNSKNSALPTTSKDSQGVKPGKSSYWLTPEEIEELHRDAKQGMEEIWALMQERKRKAQAAK